MNKPKCSQLILLLLLHPKNYIIVNCVIFQWNFLLKFLILERFINKWAHTPTQQNPYLHDLAMKFCLFSFHFLREIAFQMPLNVVQTNCFFFLPSNYSNCAMGQKRKRQTKRKRWIEWKKKKFNENIFW